MKKLSTILLISLLAVFLAVGSAIATPTLWVGFGTNPGEYFLIEDGSALDGLPAVDGAVLFNGAVGIFSVNVTTGITKPVVGSADLPEMDLNSVNVSGGAGTLAIWWSDNDFTGDGPFAFDNLIGGTTDGTVDAWTLIDNDNLIQYPGQQTWDEMLYNEQFGAGAFSDEATAYYDPGNPFGMSLVALITHTEAGQITSFDFNVNTAVPEPATMLLLGSGLIGLAGIGRKKFFKKV